MTTLPEIRARRIAVVDGRGRDRIVLTMVSGEHPSVALFDADGSARASIWLHRCNLDGNQAFLNLGGSEGDHVVEFYSARDGASFTVGLPR
jgi:hypothetical protein